MDAIIQRLQNIASFNIYQINTDGTCQPWYNVTGKEVVDNLLLSDSDLRGQVQTVNGRIAYWGRLASQAKRVLEIKEREYRIWKATIYLHYRNDGEKHTEKELDALIRTSPGYVDSYQQIERAEEAYNSTLAVVDAWKSKLQVMKMAIYRQNTEDGSQLSL